jgi:hypothetical protein
VFSTGLYPTRIRAPNTAPLTCRQIAIDGRLGFVCSDYVADVAVSPSIDESRWPLVVVAMPRQSMSDVELVKFLDRLSQFCERGEQYVLIVDVRPAPPLAPTQRRIVAERLDQLAEKYPNTMRGVAVVLSNTVQRGILKVLTWLTRMPFQMQPSTSIDVALSWASRLMLQPPRKSKRPSLMHSEHR